MKVFVYAVIWSVLLTGCASVVPVQTRTRVVDRPPINEVRSEELGNTLLEYFISNTQPSIRILDQFKFFATGVAYPPQILRPRGVGEQMNTYIVEDTGEPPHAPMTVCYDQTDKVLFFPSGFGSCDALLKSMVSSGALRVEPAEYVDIRAPQFRQELIYNGKVGNNVKFLYRELSGGYMRAPFTQDIQYDLQEGKEIGFKGARIEIINSTNRKIEYKVLKSFNR